MRFYEDDDMGDPTGTPLPPPGATWDEIIGDYNADRNNYEHYSHYGYFYRDVYPNGRPYYFRRPRYSFYMADYPVEKQPTDPNATPLLTPPTPTPPLFIFKRSVDGRSWEWNPRSKSNCERCTQQDPDSI